MFKNTFHTNSYLTLFYSLGNDSLQLWTRFIKNAKDDDNIKELVDEHIQSPALQITSNNITNTYIKCPTVGTLGICLPVLVLVVKNLNEFFSFEVEVLDDEKQTRRFRLSNFHSEVRFDAEICTIPLRMEENWNYIHLNLIDLCKKIYGRAYECTQRVTINANCRLRRVYFAQKVTSEEELPFELRLYSNNN